MLTIEQLEAMPYGTIFATGVAWDKPGGLFMAGTSKELRWVAVRGGIADWTLYCHFSSHDTEWIKRLGYKVCMEHHIKMLVPCYQAAFNAYRY